MSYITLDQLQVYQLCKIFSQEAWLIYKTLDWSIKKIWGDQYIRSVDSVGANVAEGYGRYHFLDKIKFYYNARGSLLEAKHWLDLGYERKIISKEKYLQLIEYYQNINLGLNGLINSNYQNKK